MKIVAHYDIKLGCNNCGMADFYQVRRGYEFLDFDCNNDIGHEHSRTRYGLGEQDRRENDMYCRNCYLPCLVMVNWEAGERTLAAQPTDRTLDT